MGHIVIVAVAGISDVNALGMDRRADHGGDVSSGESCSNIGPVAVGLSGPDIGIGGAGVQFSFLDRRFSDAGNIVEAGSERGAIGQVPGGGCESGAIARTEEPESGSIETVGWVGGSEEGGIPVDPIVLQSERSPCKAPGASIIGSHAYISPLVFNPEGIGARQVERTFEAIGCDDIAPIVQVLGISAFDSIVLGSQPVLIGFDGVIGGSVHLCSGQVFTFYPGLLVGFVAIKASVVGPIAATGWAKDKVMAIGVPTSGYHPASIG